MGTAISDLVNILVTSDAKRKHDSPAAFSKLYFPACEF